MSEATDQLLENNPQLDREPSNTRVKTVNLLSASQEEIGEFRKTVTQRDGKIASLVHPYWQEDPQQAGRDSEEEFYGSTNLVYKKQRDQYMESCINNNIPLVLFEETTAIDLLPQKLPSEAQGTVYVIPTKPGTSEPDSNDKNPWNPVANLLRQAGVKHIVLGGLVLDFNLTGPVQHGEYLDKYQQKINEEIEDLKRYGKQLAESKGTSPAAFRWLQKNVAPIHCVGMAAQELLKAGLDVSFSPISLWGYYKIKNIA